MGRSAFVLSFLRSLVLVLALLSVIFAAPIKHRRSNTGLGDVLAVRIAPDTEHRASVTLPSIIARAVTIHVRSALSPLSAIKRAASDSLSALFPVSHSASWSTSSDVQQHLPLNEETLRVRKGSVPNGAFTEFQQKNTVKAHYPQGSYRPGAQDAPKGGFGFYAAGPADVDLSTAKEATFGYSVWFSGRDGNAFSWNKGGKLPGLYGGDDDTVATGCSGGRKDTRCFSARLMWRPKGAGEMYTYLPPGLNSNDALCGKPLVQCNAEYGVSLGRSSFDFKTNEWTTVTQRVRLNDANKSNGELELFVGGTSLFKFDNLTIRDSSEGRIRGIQMETFFGGHTKDWATPVDQDVYFADLSVAITEKLSD